MICGIDTDPDMNPEYHPCYIIDPFDINYNPGKAVKFNDSIIEVLFVVKDPCFTFSHHLKYANFFDDVFGLIKSGGLFSVFSATGNFATFIYYNN